MSQGVDWKFYVFVCLVVAFILSLNVGVHMLPKDMVVLHSTYDSPVLLVANMYTMNFAHSNDAHLKLNLMWFAIVSIFVVLYESMIPAMGGEHRADIFYLFVLSALTVLPLVISLNTITLWIFEGVPTGCSACGFSAIGAAFFGYVAYAMCRLLKVVDAGIKSRIDSWNGYSFKFLVLVMGVFMFLGWLSDVRVLSVASANAHLGGFVFGFGLYWLMDRSENKDISSWLPGIFRTRGVGYEAW